MTKVSKRVSCAHLILVLIGAALLGASMVYYLIKWPSLPPEPGIHFAPDGSFDVYASKVLGFYPHLMGGIAIAGLYLAGRFAAKKNIGLSLTEKGDVLFRSELMLTMGVLAALLGFFFANWSLCVSVQRPLDDELARAVISAAMAAGFLGIISEAVTCGVCRQKKAKTNADVYTRSRADRLGSWVLTGGGLFVLLWCYERLPMDDLEDKYHGLAYFANFGRYLDKRLLFLPYIYLIPALIVLSVIGARAKKNDRPARCRFAGRLSFINSVFVNLWILMLMSEQPVGGISLMLFAGSTALSTALYIREENKSAPQAAEEPLG